MTHPKVVGSETPRVFTPPLRELTPETSLGFDCIQFAENVVGVTLFPWQKWLLIHMLELLPSGTLRFRKVVVLVARQNGKSMLAEVLALFFMAILGARLVLGTAQDMATAEDLWADTLNLAEESESLAPLLGSVSRATGNKSFDLKTGEKYKVKAANRRGGRGARKVKLVLLDELREHQSWDAWGAITKTTQAEPEAMILALSNAGDASSIVLRYLRLMAHKAIGDPDGICADADPTLLLDESAADVEDVGVDVDDSLALFEWSADPDLPVSDREGWAQANPSLGHTITERTLASDCKTDPEHVFKVECPCHWVDSSLTGPFPAGKWERGIVPAAAASDAVNQIVGDVAACVELSHDRSRAAIAYAGARADGTIQAEIVRYARGLTEAVEWLTSPDRTVKPAELLIRTSSPAASAKADLEGAVSSVRDWTGREVSQACGALYDIVRGPVDQDGGDIPDAPVELWHLPHTALDVAAATAVTRPFGDTWAWDLAKSPVDVSPLFALTGAVWGALHPTEKPRVSAYADGHDLLII